MGSRPKMSGFAVALGGLLAPAACSAPDDRLDDEVAGYVEQPLCTTNGLGNTCGPACACPSGWGDCDANRDCEPGLVCRADLGARFGMPALFDICVADHCTNGVVDASLGETGIDSGGECGACPANGTGNACGAACRCGPGGGDCDGDADCAPGLVCKNDVGALYGMHQLLDVCVAAHCANGVLDADLGETSLDRGGECGGCPGNGASDGCSAFCPCASGWGDCDGDHECAPGLVCHDDAGAGSGLPPDFDVCGPPGCAPGFTPCGGTCVALAALASDSSNCGSCGHDCLGAVCSNGFCAPQKLVQANINVYPLASDGTSLFYSIHGKGIYRWQQATGPALIVPANTFAYPGAIDATSLYWIDRQLPAQTSVVVKRAAKDGSGVGTFDSGPAAGATVEELVIDSTRAYMVWRYGPSGSMRYQLSSFPLGGGARTVLVDRTVPFQEIAVNDTFVFWSESEGAVFRIPKGGGTQVALPLGDAAAQGFLTADGTRVYRADFGHTRSGIWSFPANGDPPAGIAETFGGAAGIANDSTRLYWIEMETESGLVPTLADRVMRADKDGSNVLQLANPFDPQTLLLDDRYVYWTDRAFALYRLAK
jgi:hypothetical protein